jgi:glutamate--cysteine ligase
MSGHRQFGSDQPVTSVDELVEFLRRAEKPSDAWRVGTEHEKIGLYRDGHRPVPHEGERGIGALLERIAAEDGWQRIYEDDALIALEKGNASITLEPGGQLELSGAPLRTIHETCDEFSAHLALMKRVSEPFGIEWLGLGLDPLHGVPERPVMPKARYRIMRSYLPTRGAHALEMMFATATVQANFDYASEADMIEKLRTGLAVSLIVSAIFANSSLGEGKANGFVSKRVQIWEHTDPDRCGFLPFAFDPDFGYRKYVEWAIDVPMFFVVREGRYRAAHPLTFRQFIQRGFEGERATFADFDRHLTTLFPEVRLKRVIEVRGADAVPKRLTCSLPAIWKGILYDAEARAAALALGTRLGTSERDALRGEVARRGLGARFGSLSMRDAALELARISREGLRRIGHAGSKASDETSYLEPVFEQIELGKSPGQVVLERWEGEWERSVDRLIEYARY